MVMNLKSLIEAMCYAAGHISGTLYIDSNGEDYKLYVVYSCWNIKKECWYREGLVYNKTNIWTSDDEWNNNWENIIARSIKWNPPTFWDGEVEAFLPRITNEFVKAKLASVEKDSDEFKWLFGTYVEDDFDDKYGEFEKFGNFRDEFWHETARKFCDEHGIKYEE